jgi:hypothetical protein
MSKPGAEPEEDFLTEDPEISSQKVVLISFLSPEKILANKDVFFFQNFLKDYELQWRTSKLEAWMAEQLQAVNTKLENIAGNLSKLSPTVDLSGSSVVADSVTDVRNSLLRVDKFVEDFQQHCRKNLREISQGTVKQEYEDFLFKNSAALEEEFFKQNEFRTTIRGIKVRGVFASEAEAAVRAKKLQRSDPNFNIYMGSVGKWMAWEPEPSKVGEQEYANEQLNTLMKKYRENEDARDTFYNEQKAKRVGTARTRDSAADSTNIAEAQADAESATPAVLPSAGGSYDAMFSGPADLAIQRKMEKKE